jgi:hypothetical protein
MDGEEKKMIEKEEIDVEEIERNLEPFLKFVYKRESNTVKSILNSIELSDGTTQDAPEYQKKLLKTLKRTTGTYDREVGIRIGFLIAAGMSGDDNEQRLAQVHALLPSLQPQDASEALLLEQFLALEDSAMNCLHQANFQENFYHKERFFILASKLSAQANATMQTLLKYRSGGKQQIQVIHVSGDAKAIIANDMKLQGEQG